MRSIIPAVLTLVVLGLVACGGGVAGPTPGLSPTTSPDSEAAANGPTEREITDGELSRMVLPQLALGTEYSSFALDYYGFHSNEDEIADSCEPDEEKQDIERYGRINGYEATYISRERGEAQAGIFSVGTVVDLHRHADGAAEEFDVDLEKLREDAQLGTPDCEGGTIFEFDEFMTNPVGDSSRGFVLFGGDEEVQFYATAVVFVRGRLAAFAAVAHFDNEDHSDEAEALARKLDDRIQAVLRGDLVRTIYVRFNTRAPPFDDLKFRQALVHALDRAMYGELLSAGSGTPAYGILQPGFPGYSPDFRGLTYDPDLARQLLDESRYADPSNRPRITIVSPRINDDSGHLEVMEIVQDMWSQVLGIEVEISVEDVGDWVSNFLAGRHQASLMPDLPLDYSDPQGFLDDYFHADGRANFPQHSNPEVDRILDQARAADDRETRAQLYRQVEEIIAEEAVWVPLWNP